MTEPTGFNQEDAFTDQAEKLATYGVGCENNACSEVLGLLQQCIAEIQKLAREGYQINLPAIARQLANTTDTEDWNQLITVPRADVYAQFVATINSIRKRETAGHLYDDRQTILQMYRRVKDGAATEIGDCICLLLETKQILYGKKAGFAVTDVDKLVSVLTQAIAN